MHFAKTLLVVAAGLLAHGLADAQVCTAIGDPNGTPTEQLWFNYWNTSTLSTSRAYSDHPDVVSIVTFNAQTLFCGQGQGVTFPELQKQQFIGYISEARPDIVVLQEVCNWDGAWDALQNETSGYTLLRYQPQQSQYGANHFGQAFLLKDSTVQLLEEGPLFENSNVYWPDYRRPYMVKVRVKKGKNVLPELFVSNFHADSGADQDSYDNRLDAAVQFRDWLEHEMAGRQVVLAGDFNDAMYGSIYNNEPDSPYQTLVDSAEAEVLTVCHEVNQQQSNRSPQANQDRAMIDNVVVSNAVVPVLHSTQLDSRLFEVYEKASLSQVYDDDFEIDDGFSIGDRTWDYVLSTHIPVRTAIAFPQRPQVLTRGVVGGVSFGLGSGHAAPSIELESVDLMAEGTVVELEDLQTGAALQVSVSDRTTLVVPELRQHARYMLQVRNVFTKLHLAEKFTAR